MERVLLIRYGEISLKGQNRRQFEKKLQENIEIAVSAIDVDAGKRVSKSQGRLYVTGIQTQFEHDYLEALSCVPGIVAVSPGFAVESDLETIKQAAISAVKQAMPEVSPPATFKVDTRRADKDFPVKSPEVNREVGAAVLRNVPGLAVDVHNPSIHLTVEIRPGHTYIYRGQVPGPGGLPVGTSGKGILLVSGGIDSPVAGYMAMKRGVAVDALHFWSYPITGERARDKVVDICKVLRKYNPHLRLFVAPFTRIQTEIMDKCPEKYRVITMRRMMMRVASRICRNTGSLAIFTGENLGQVASQTLESLSVIESVSDFPVLRPLICFDKVETVRLAEQIGTYDISILPYEDCCSVFVPKHPVTKPRLDAAVNAEKRLDVKQLAEECAMNTDVFDIG
ncbi:MAG TPA: tRNA 4-thiouridine(8) synthase ThiI [Firmicutes bacterium]|nr:tRNA 4-thiouridine(8) synthase ThiI [Candidatus Fermentithermobacillaceae bacterium]